MLLSLFHPPWKVKKSLMLSRGKTKKRRNWLWLLFPPPPPFLFATGITMFICGVNGPARSSFWFEGLHGLVLGNCKFFRGVGVLNDDFGWVFLVLIIYFAPFLRRIWAFKLFEQPRLVNPVPVAPSSRSPEAACSYCAAFIIKLVRCE